MLIARCVRPCCTVLKSEHTLSSRDSADANILVCDAGNPDGLFYFLWNTRPRELAEIIRWKSLLYIAVLYIFSSYKQSILFTHVSILLYTSDITDDYNGTRILYFGHIHVAM